MYCCESVREVLTRLTDNKLRHCAYTQDGKKNVDEQVSTAAALEKDAEGREDDGKNDLADVAEGALMSEQSSVKTECGRGMVGFWSKLTKR